MALPCEFMAVWTYPLKDKYEGEPLLMCINPLHTKSIFLEFVHQILSWFHIWWTNSRKIIINTLTTFSQIFFNISSILGDIFKNVILLKWYPVWNGLIKHQPKCTTIWQVYHLTSVEWFHYSTDPSLSNKYKHNQ